jgi:hypothetical protein
LEEIARPFDGATANVSAKDVLEEKTAVAGQGQVDHAEEI